MRNATTIAHYNGSGMSPNPAQKKRLFTLLATIALLTTAIALILNALTQNIHLYLTPSEIKDTPQVHKDRTRFRLGGLVKAGSYHQEKALNHFFEITDQIDTIHVHFKGLLPDLFREGQGIVTQGYLSNTHTFIAEQVLAKHDENYHPPQPKSAHPQIT